MTLFLVANILAGIFYLILGLFVHIRGQGDRPNNLFSALCIGMAGMTFSAALMYSAESETFVWVWHLVGMFFWLIVYPMLLWLVVELATGRHLPVYKVVTGMLVAASVVIVLAALPDLGGQIKFAKTELGWARDFSALGYWPWVGVGYSILHFLLIFVLLVRWLRRATLQSERRQALLLLITGSIVFVVAAVNVKVIIPADKFPVVPWPPHLLGVIWAIGFVVGIWKYKMMPGMPSMAITEVLAAIQDGIVFLDPAGLITEANPRVNAIIGVEPQDLLGHNINDVAVFQQLRPVICNGGPRFEDEVNVVNAEGVCVPVNVVVTRVHNDYGQYKGTVVVLQDLRSTRELVEAKRQESLAIMSAGIAHDFNNLLTVAGGYLELCLKGFDRDTTNKNRGYLIEASFALAQARSLTGQLMTFSRGGDPVRRNVSVERLLDESATLVLAGTSVALVKETESGLWPVYVDPVQTGQVFNNLLLNAVQSMTSGGTIIIRQNNLPGQGDDPDMVRIEIEDTGCGIPSAIMDRIFEPFFTARKGGTGLGLASVKSIITRHGGRIKVESAVGQGSLFTVDLPRGKAPDVARQPGDAELTISNGNVLVMDDIESVRGVAVEMLRVLGYRAESVKDGDDAVKSVKARSDEGNPFDVVILDVTVPGGTGGIVALSNLKRIQPAIGAVVSSGYSAGSELADFKNCGFDAALPKPYTLENLSGAVSVALEMKKARTTGRNRTISQWVKRERIQKSEGQDAAGGSDRRDPM